LRRKSHQARHASIACGRHLHEDATMSVKIGGDKAVCVPLILLKDAAARPKCNSSATATKYQVAEFHRNIVRSKLIK
jgi:hypothetical protein